MKRLCTLLFVCLIAVFAAAQQQPEQHDPRYPVYAPVRQRMEDLLTEKLYVTVVTPGDPYPFMLNTSTADLWKLSPSGTEWFYLGDPQGARSGRTGKFQLISLQTGRVLILDTAEGEAWVADGNSWTRIDDPDTRKSRYKSAPKTWDEMWEQFKKPSR
jgi:hypothetical protein